MRLIVLNFFTQDLTKNKYFLKQIQFKHRLDSLSMENVRNNIGYNTKPLDVPLDMYSNSSSMSRGFDAWTTDVDDQSLLGDLKPTQLIKLVGLLQNAPNNSPALMPSIGAFSLRPNAVD